MALVAFPLAAKAVDPPYQKEMQRLTLIFGSLYFLQPLCGFNQTDWRKQTGELIELDRPDDDRKQRLMGAFNEGYNSYRTTYNSCTASANQARWRLLNEAYEATNKIRTRFAE